MTKCFLKVWLNLISTAHPLSTQFFSKAIISIFLVAFIFNMGCKKDPSTLGLNVQPPGDRITETFPFSSNVSAWTFSEDSITSDERTFNLLGCYIDPVFGRTSAGFVSQVRLSSSNVTFGSISSVDSIVLYLSINGYYGDTSTAQAQQKVKVYELTQSISLADTLYSNFRANNYIDISTPIADFAYTPNYNDTVLRIPIDNALASKILNASTAQLASPDVFIEYFKGLYVCPDTTIPGNIILYHNLTNPRTKLSIFYNGNTTPYNMVIDSKCARVSIFKHDYSTTVFGSSLDDTTQNSDLVYLQSLAGPRVKIKIPSFESWKDSGNVAINKAELILKVDELSIGNFAPPAKLFLVAIDENNKYQFIFDYLKNASYFGGTYNSVTKTYKFNIPLYLQRVINGTQTDRGFYLFPESNRVYGNRVVIQNGVNNERIKLDVTYTKL